MSYKLVFERFDSLNALLRANDTREENKVFKGKTLSSLETNLDSKMFTKTKSYDEAKELLATGWEEPLEQLKKFNKNSVTTNTQAEKRRPRNAVVGYAPCVPNAIIGLPNSMVSTELERQKVKAVTIVYGVSVLGGTSTQTVIDAGTTMLNIINELELQGIRVKLTVEVRCSANNGELACCWADIKDWKEVLDIKKLAFPIAHPSMQRRIGFRWMETNGNITSSGFSFGYGSTLSASRTYTEQVDTLKSLGLLQNNEYYINVQLCEECNYDAEKVMEIAGMKNLKTNK